MSDANMKVKQKGNSLTGRYHEAKATVTGPDGKKETVTGTGDTPDEAIAAVKIAADAERAGGK